ncbi:MAG: 50S ribosomal protein L3 N(5)-glutamine methyltransferase [Gammaproteobacteria bacterium]|nr:50S ribosomal protein L3 N(5)-glutamine methyltransferase [Gammaproteobacteria bacterium]MYK47111.1 50S ribosomal protein L3 N(5)-glutamine methyltransferase [Gammaproteobacteria bacterium]
MPSQHPDRDAEALIDAFAARLEAAGVVFGHGTDNARDEAWRLVTGVLRGSRVTPRRIAELEALLRRRIEERVPVPYLTGEAWFGDLRLRIPPGVMIPRSPIAELLATRIHPWLRREPNRILDLCCGSGCIGIAAAYVFRGAWVDLVDDDDRAVAAARENVRDTDPAVSSRIEVVASDLFESLGSRRYDLVLCNPPYARSVELDVAAEEFQHEPRHGLDGGADGLAVWRRIVDDIGSRLNPGGVLVGEAGGLSHEFDAAFPQLHAVWVDLERAEPQPGGGFGVFVSVGETVGVGRVG